MRKIFVSFAAAVALATPFVASPASADILTNGSFEDGDFTGWTLTVATKDSGLDQVIQGNGSPGYSAEDGNYFAYLGNTKDATLSQTVTDDANRILTLTYFMGTQSGNQYGSNTFSAFWNGVLISGSKVKDDNKVGYDPYTFTVLSTGSDILSFEFKDGSDHIDLDNISLVPEPATLAMFSAGLLGLAGFYRRRSAKA